jgi:hypothetical protein
VRQLADERKEVARAERKRLERNLSVTGCLT